jgi:hypothetical protein
MKTGQKRAANNSKKRASSKPKSYKSRVSEGPPWPWENVPKKTEAFLRIMRKIIEDPDLGREYANDDGKARQAFKDEHMIVPDDIKVVFLPAGDSDKLSGSSAVIELPQARPGDPPPTDDELAELFVANYHIVW